MYVYLDLIFAILSTTHGGKLSILKDSNTAFRVWITDSYAFVMNHATMMMVMEPGRIDFVVRSGFFKRAREKKWYFPLGMPC